MRLFIIWSLLILSGLILTSPAAAAQERPITVGNLVDFSGRTAVVGREYGQGKIDAVAYINAHGGIKGEPITLLTVDYAYIVPRAIAAYKRWMANGGVVAIQGWGTGDTEALVDFITRDHIPYYSSSYSGRLTDPQGRNPATKKPAPYNFFVGPSYSDGVRALIDWAMQDWAEKGRPGAPSYVHMGGDHPYPNAAKAPGESYARARGMTVLPAIRYSLNPADFTQPCQALKASGADYAYLANTSNSNIALLKACRTVGVKVQFMANIWGYDENVMARAGKAADGVVWVMGAGRWGDRVPGWPTLHAISQMSDPKGKKRRAVHYVRGVCSVFFMKEAMEAARDMPGGITGPNIKQAMESRQNWVPAGLEGGCPPATWTAQDHRGVVDVLIYRGRVQGGKRRMSHIFTAHIPRKAEWLGQ